MITEAEAKRFALDWIDAWNAHDLDRILAHYSEDVEFTSPFVVRLFNEASGTIKGKTNLRSYFQRGLNTYPELHFELLKVLTGVNSVTLYYRSVQNLQTAEVMQFGNGNQIAKVLAHYSA
jgi:hypothetical protein